MTAVTWYLNQVLVASAMNETRYEEFVTVIILQAVGTHMEKFYPLLKNITSALVRVGLGWKKPVSMSPEGATLPA